MEGSNVSNLEESGILSSDDSEGEVFSHSIPVEIVISTIVWLMCLLAVVGNILVFVVVLGDKQLRSNVANIYILNLASADLCVGLNSLTLSNIWRYEDGPFPRAICAFWVIADYSACLQSGFAITLISLDRYFMVTKYQNYRKYQSMKLAYILITATWIFAILFFAAPILSSEIWGNTGAMKEPDNLVRCYFKVMYVISYTAAQIVVGFVTPAIAVTYFNVGVYYNIIKRSRGLVSKAAIAPSRPRVWAVNQAASSGAGNTAPPLHPQDPSRTTFRKHRKAAVTLAAIVGIFTLGWVPYYAVMFLFIVDKIEYNSVLWSAVYYTIWANSAVNPFIYAATSPRMRKSFLRILFCKKTSPHGVVQTMKSLPNERK